MHFELAKEKDLNLAMTGKRNLRGAVGAFCAPRATGQLIGVRTARCMARSERGVRVALAPAESISETILGDLRAESVAVKGGVQAALDAGLDNVPKLSAVVALLVQRHRQRWSDVHASYARLYHALSKEFHGVGDAIMVREADFPAPTEMLALCALLEAYDVPYSYMRKGNEARSVSPYGLSAAERLSVTLPRAARFSVGAERNKTDRRKNT
jgi:hypothetical protein